MKFKPDFLHQLQENQKEKIPINATVNFRYNNMESNPTQKTLRLSEFHPKKRLIFYVDVHSVNQPIEISSSNTQNNKVNQGGNTASNLSYPQLSQSLDRS
jgi:hypothetical protein